MYELYPNVISDFSSSLAITLNFEKKMNILTGNSVTI